MIPIKVAYILFRFPSLSETFVAEEIQKIQNTGVKVSIYSLLSPKKEIVQPVSLKLLPSTYYAPSLFSLELWFSQIYYLFRVPGVYFNTLWTLLKQPAPNLFLRPKRLIIFFKSVWIARELKDQPVQLLHSHFAWLSAAASWIISQLLDIPFTVTTHAFDIYSQKNDLLALTTREAARVVTISENNKIAMLDMNRSLNAKKINVIHCGIDLNFFQNETQGKASHKHPLQIISVGSLIEKKGHEYLIRACHVLKEDGLDFNCVIVGGGELCKELNKLTHDLDLEDQVSLAGTQSQDWVRERLGQSDVFVLACVNAGDNDRDGIPVAMMEALAMRVPVISTPVSGIPELIKHEETGLIVPERDPESIARAIARLCQEPLLGQALARKGREKVEGEFDIASNVDRLKQVFSEVVGQNL